MPQITLDVKEVYTEKDTRGFTCRYKKSERDVPADVSYTLPKHRSKSSTQGPRIAHNESYSVLFPIFGSDMLLYPSLIKVVPMSHSINIFFDSTQPQQTGSYIPFGLY